MFTSKIQMMKDVCHDLWAISVESMQFELLTLHLLKGRIPTAWRLTQSQIIWLNSKE